MCRSSVPCFGRHEEAAVLQNDQTLELFGIHTFLGKHQFCSATVASAFVFHPYLFLTSLITKHVAGLSRHQRLTVLHHSSTKA
jgi:hypothetical protein